MIYVFAVAAIVGAIYAFRRFSEKKKEEELQRLKRSIAVTKRVSGQHRA
jgi:hypothetical protein